MIAQAMKLTAVAVAALVPTSTFSLHCANEKFALAAKPVVG